MPHFTFLHCVFYYKPKGLLGRTTYVQTLVTGAKLTREEA